MKPHQPKITYLCPSPDGYRPLNARKWRTPMRLTRQGSGRDDTPALSYGQYFEAIADVISRDDYGSLVDAASIQLAADISFPQVDQVLIYAEKHGSDYHPARIEVMASGACARFVMNVAVTSRGKTCLLGEFEVLERLNNKYDFPFLPRAYFMGEAFNNRSQDADSDTSMPMFLADWFHGYHEFHLSTDDRDGSQGLVLWDTEKAVRRLSQTQAWRVYSRVGEIMTLYYDVETFEQIFPWHHAAGDFIVKAEAESLDVRLVTARQYAPMLDRSAGVPLNEALLFFFLNLSMRMRLDRFDGVGGVAWAGDDCVDATLEGFMKALRKKELQSMIGEGRLVAAFLEHCRSVGKTGLSQRLYALVDACDPAAPDIPVILRHLDGHVSRIDSAVRGARDS